MRNKSWLRFGLCGAAAGLINGFFGAGGGMVLVPLLIHLGRLEDKKAFPSAIAVILPLCFATIAVYWTQELLSVAQALPYLAGGLLGGLAGGILFKNVPTQFLHKGLGLIILWGGFRLLWS